MHEQKAESSLDRDVMIFGIKTTVPKIISAFDKYNALQHENAVVHPIGKGEKTFFGRTPDAPSNPIGIYFWGTVKSSEVVFEFYKGNRTLDYLERFYSEFQRGNV